jgi:hypothetical protein
MDLLVLFALPQPAAKARRTVFLQTLGAARTVCSIHSSKGNHGHG